MVETNNNSAAFGRGEKKQKTGVSPRQRSEGRGRQRNKESSHGVHLKLELQSLILRREGRLCDVVCVCSAMGGADFSFMCLFSFTQEHNTQQFHSLMSLCSHSVQPRSSGSPTCCCPCANLFCCRKIQKKMQSSAHEYMLYIACLCCA